MKTLSDAAMKELRRPFTTAAVKVKVQSTRKDGSAAQAAFYIDARHVVERLNHVVGIEAWSDEYEVLFAANPGAHRDFHFPVECRLTVCGITKADVGVYQKSTSDSLALKSGYSDALKRAGVKFGIGSSLYALPKFWVEGNGLKKNQEGKITGFSVNGEKYLRDCYTQFLASGHCKSLFGEALDHGDVLDPEGEEGDPPDSAGGPTGSGESSSGPPANPAVTSVTDPQKVLISALRGQLTALKPDHPMIARKVVTMDEASTLIEDLKKAIEWAQRDAAELPAGQSSLPVDPVATAEFDKVAQ